MSNIDISELNNDGSQLFSDSESFLSEMSEQELAEVVGGLIPTPIASVVTAISVGANMLRESLNVDGDLALPPDAGIAGIDVGFSGGDINFSSNTGIDPSAFTGASSFSFL